jgi:hypothetical protein
MSRSSFRPSRFADGSVTPDRRAKICLSRIATLCPARRLPPTARSSWCDRDVTVTGDTELAARFLDAVNII